MVLIAKLTTYNIHYMSLLMEEVVPTKNVRQVQEVRQWQTQPEEEGHRVEYAAWEELRGLRTGTAGSGSGRARW